MSRRPRPASDALGFPLRAITENEKQPMPQYLTGLQGLLERYTLPTACESVFRDERCERVQAVGLRT